jgi:hypothetical protein
MYKQAQGIEWCCAQSMWVGARRYRASCCCLPPSRGHFSVSSLESRRQHHSAAKKGRTHTEERRLEQEQWRCDVSARASVRALCLCARSSRPFVSSAACCGFFPSLASTHQLTFSFHRTSQPLLAALCLILASAHRPSRPSYLFNPRAHSGQWLWAPPCCCRHGGHEPRA